MDREERLPGEIMEELALQAMTVDLSEGPALESIRANLERMEHGARTPLSPALRSLCRALMELTGKARESSAPDPFLGLLREGLGILQRGMMAPEAGDAGEEAFLKKMGGGRPPSPAPAGLEEPPPLSQDPDLYREFVAEALEHLEAAELRILDLEQSPEDADRLNAVFRPFHTIKGVAGFLNLSQIQEFAHALESLLDDLRNRKLSVQRRMIDAILEAADFLKRMILDLRDHLAAGRATPSLFSLEEHLQKIARLRGPDSASGGAPLPSEKTPPSRGQESPQPPGDEGSLLPVPFSVVKVDTAKLDNLVDTVGELVIAQSLVQESPAWAGVQDQKLSRDFARLVHITAELQRISMSLRMIPIRQTFQKMIRLVRDLSGKSGKKVELIMSGEGTEIDRHLVDSLQEPLVHMIRNAVDHGIETPSRRRQAGKPEAGRIFLRASQKGGYIVIEIEDDGEGIEKAKILRKARERGLIPAEASLAEAQIYDLVFEPGFSTAEEISEISGRGVGMDVVRRALELVRGRVEILSREGEGCRFIIRVPLTLAIIDGIVVRAGPERYIIPTVFIQEILRPSAADLTTVLNRGRMLKRRNSLLPLILLAELLGIPPQKERLEETLVVVVENGAQQKGLVVEDLMGKQEVVIKNLPERIKIPGVAGATILGDGRVGLILDVHGILGMEE